MKGVISIDSVKDPFISITDSRIIANVTFYEIVWVMARRALIKA